MKIITRIPLVILGLIVLLLALVSLKFVNDRKVDYEVSTAGLEIPNFDPVTIPFQQRLDEKSSLPFMASAIIDIDNDGHEEIFLGGGPGQSDALYRYRNGAFEDVYALSGLQKSAIADASFGASVIDVDNNGYSDLIVSRTNGIWLYRNNGGQFNEQLLDIQLPADTSPLSVAVADINRDGHVDLYVAGYIRKELVEGQNIFREGYGGSSLMLLNNGDMSFTDVTQSAGLEYKHNTFMGIFVDIDNDGLEDLVVAHDTGHVKTWKNLGDLKFQDMPNPDTARFSYPMGIGVTDHGNDGLVDFFFSNVGTSPPTFLVRGDLSEDQHFNSKWMLFKNRGDFRIDDVADEVKIADYEFSWGGIFEDFNLDGRDDLVVSENYIGLPPHKLEFLRLPGRFLLQNAAGEFAASGAQAGVQNFHYSISPLTADFNQDGYPDLVHVNLAGLAPFADECA